jgi:hypothetical protein
MAQGVQRDVASTPSARSALLTICKQIDGFMSDYWRIEPVVGATGLGPSGELCGPPQRTNIGTCRKRRDATLRRLRMFAEICDAYSPVPHHAQPIGELVYRMYGMLSDAAFRVRAALAR